MIEKSWHSSPILVVAQRQSLSLSQSGSKVYQNLLSTLANNYKLKFYGILNDFKWQGAPLRDVTLCKLSEGKVNFSNIPLFYKNIIKCTNVFLKLHSKSLIHHFFMVNQGLESFDILAVTGKTEGHPFIIGPAEATHPYFEDDFTAYSKTSLLPKMQYTIMKGIRKSLDVAFKVAFEKTICKADLIVVYNDRTKKLYSKYVSNRKIKVIPGGVKLDEFPFLSPLSNSHIVLSVGNLIRRKNFNALIVAMSNVRKQNSDARLLIIGDGPQKAALNSLAAKLHVPLTIKSHLSRSELLECYKSCRLFCQPSLAESYSTTILEAMAVGRPVVSTRTNGSEMVDEGKTGFLVSAGDSDELANKILAVMTDNALTNKMGFNARNVVERSYNWSNIARSYYEAYTKIGDSY